ncbi:hypothetical protein H8I91_13135 [Serratia fonticola]|uniref:hypothetical protein n=1 Tax=Serratia fonticola TaxID=47917 RepID=UPI001646227C|nr:hypothetical protein [Serratia fonticola]MBC3251213.1 hypothetical protein [Serratia fonticola]
MKKLLIVLPLVLTGCAKVGDYQARCEQQYPKFSDMANCLDSNVKSDYRMASAPSPKLYVLAAKMLGEGVDQGKISDAQARLELQNLYVNMKRQETADQQAQVQSIQQGLLNAQAVQTLQTINNKVASQPAYTPLQPSNVTTNCTRYGNSVTCNSNSY